MLVRKTKIQLVVFVIISVVAVVYALVRFTDVEETFGQGGYSVQLQLAESGGIFTGAEVTYRGFNIGTVGPLSLTEDGTEAELDIEADAPPVPADLKAVVANRSAVGEQYVDLQPRSSGGPFLEAGSVIDSRNATTPVPTEKLIGDLSSLAKSVPTDSLRTVVDESYDAFNGTGRDLQQLMDTTQEFTKVASEHVPQTVELLDSGTKVLRTQNEMAGSMRSFSRDLRKLSQTLKDSDADVRKLVDVAPQVGDQVQRVLAETGPGLSALTANLLTTSNLLVPRQDGLEMMFIAYPMVTGGAYSVTPGDGTAHLGLALNLFNPPSCTKGYRSPDEYRPGNDTSERDPKGDAYCAEPVGSPINVRGSQNAPYHGVPVKPSQQQLEENSTRDEEELASLRGTPGVAGSPGLDITSLDQLAGLARP
ncbi:MULTISPECIES: MlaD family protein [Prauserella salsuginis group]|uniref:Phospholipid/cholesterol/gamma-HCH transport system substrate-binding protein n=2 Tax=Prauserella salsuginis group TaxID=2893672 RepID=A0A839XE00_9PSEU|nr:MULTISPECIES: MlaD family protein [Prauserella salsuginis group]MBB3662172.1 phospholipid/cholesterol/gamma-HCH transport system substrate-binding protein [Prauserella sediminis]MCR3719863.1 phospholipid/cholesterol/gamma-HCH transport system substrate-binding protein [Prauserella flava]MCR3736594.1 phospholipid/cholesterol/gamma-HCH transport system substrate-binding protein [Prauserella salsuginis]